MKLHCAVLGAGPPVVLVHGWGMNGVLWQPVIDGLSDRYQLFVPDLPGHGQSPWSTEWDSAAAWAEALGAVTPRQAVWIGWSLGGTLALLRARQAPEQVRGLMLLASTPRFLSDDSWPCGLSPKVLEQFHGALLADPSATLGRFLALQAKGDEDNRGLLKSLRHALASQPEAHPQALSLGLELLRDLDMRLALGGVSQPMHWLLGERDTLVPACMERYLRPYLLDPQMTVLPRCAHAPMFSHRRQTLKVARRFLETAHGC